MKTTLIIAPAYITVQADVRALPKGNEEVVVNRMEEVPDGFGLLCSQVFQAFGFPYIPASVIGENVYGEKIREFGERHGIEFAYESEEDMGSVLEFKDEAGNTAKMRVPGCELDVIYDQLAEEDTDEIGMIAVSADMMNGNTPDDLLEYLFRADRPLTVYINDSIGYCKDDAVADLLERNPVIITEEKYLKEQTGAEELNEAMELLQKQTKQAVIVLQQGTGVFLQKENERTMAEESAKIDADLFAAVFAAAGSAGLHINRRIAYALELAKGRYTRKHLESGRWDYEKQKLKESILEK